MRNDLKHCWGRKRTSPRKKRKNKMSNYKKIALTDEPRVELHNQLGLTGAEISINTLPPNANVPFVHSHKENEEIYGIISGKGKVIIDGEEVLINSGDWIRISPKAKRQFYSSNDSSITYICIQVKENSLTEFTATDAVIY